MFEMAKVFKKRGEYVGNDVDMWEMTKIYGEMAKVFEKLLKYVGID